MCNTKPSSHHWLQFMPEIFLYTKYSLKYIKNLFGHLHEVAICAVKTHNNVLCPMFRVPMIKINEINIKTLLADQSL